jgi:hypothetical protein
MVLGLAFQGADGEVVVARRERDQEICIRLLLNRDRLCVESRDCRWKKECGISRFEGCRQVVDNKFIQGLLNDFARFEGLDKEPECKEDTEMKLTAAWKKYPMAAGTIFACAGRKEFQKLHDPYRRVPGSLFREDTGGSVTLFFGPLRESGQNWELPYEIVHEGASSENEMSIPKGMGAESSAGLFLQHISDALTNKLPIGRPGKTVG